ncbi:hypothetical protein [Salinibaculum rarum]|uniref:hypothetical protein n=1 Tax=Salinibaculum rarum TaxID=3058903 RepID=UPI00265E2A37|nr:hypothetical protein [Salinibaculum sp. KK48]
MSAARPAQSPVGGVQDIETMAYDHTTTSNTVTVTDRSAVKSLINDYRWPVDLNLKLTQDGELSIRGYRPLMCYGHNDDEETGDSVAQEPRLPEFFERLSPYIRDGDEFFVQDVATLRLNEPVHAEEWIVTSTTIEQHTLPHSP